MKLDAFDFSLPQDLIAQHPIEPRDAARMLLVDPKQAGFTDSQVLNLVDHLQTGDVLVVNNTKVIPARLFGKRGEGKLEATLHKQLSPDTWAAFCKPAKRFVVGEKIQWSEGLSALVLDRREGEVILHFSCGGDALLAALEAFGHMPLPPYIKRQSGSTKADERNYQSPFAAEPGAVAAPTASLHFTPKVLDALKAKAVQIAEITLHVGAGTFLPVKVDNIQDHKMHSEFWSINQEAADLINGAKRLIAVGTTSLRTLESAALRLDPAERAAGARTVAGQGDTDLFITPGYDFKAVDVLLTNFHLPRSTLFMLVSAFSGLETMQAAYAHGIAQSYRFFSYGDCCLLYKAKSQA